MQPKRIKLERKKGFRLPPNTKKVDRSTKWGNPFKLTSDGWILYKYHDKPLGSAWWCYWGISGGWLNKDIVGLYEKWLRGDLQYDFPYLPDPPDVSELKGKNVACWCPLDKNCHGDVLLKLANPINNKYAN